MESLDIKIDDPFNADGDLNVANCDYQNIQAILYAEKGHFYQWPLLGVGIHNFLNSPDNVVYIRSTVIEELKKDNYDLIYFNATLDENGQLILDFDAQKLL